MEASEQQTEDVRAAGDGDRPPRLLVVLFQSTATPLGFISRPVYERIRDELNKHLPAGGTAPEIDVWLDSPGGDAHQAYKLAVLLHEMSSKLRVIVPDYAKSAATLLALVGDEIYLGPAAELGPLDAQVPEEGQTIETRSALDTADATEDLFAMALDVAAATGAQMLLVTGLSRAQVIGPALDFAASVIRPLTEQLDPVKIHARRALLKVASKYAEDLLERRHDHSSDVQRAQAIADRLVSDYPTHGYVIDRREAEALGLPVLAMSRYDLAELATSSHVLFEEEVQHGQVDHIAVIPYPEAGPVQPGSGEEDHCDDGQEAAEVERSVEVSRAGTPVADEGELDASPDLTDPPGGNPTSGAAG